MLSSDDHTLCDTAHESGALKAFQRPPARFDILSRRVPALNGGVTEEERAAAHEIRELLGALNAHVGDFRAGLKLLELADRDAGFKRNWGPIACRDAGAALMRFRDALRAAADAPKGIASLKGVRAALAPVQRGFAEAFPVARGKPEGRANSRCKAPPPRPHDDMSDAAILAGVSRAGKSVTHAEAGKAIRFELSEKSLLRLVTLRDQAFAVFDERL